jgi:WD40 repeat protein
VVVGSSPSAQFGLVLYHLDGKEDEISVRKMYGHGAAPVSEIQWSSRGDFIATAGYDRCVRIWDPLTGNQINALNLNSSAHGVIVSKHNNTIVSSRSFRQQAPDGELCVWNVDSNSHVDLGTKYKLGSIEQMCFFGRNDSQLVAATDNSKINPFGELVVFDWGTETPLLSYKLQHKGLTVVEGAPCGQIFATGGKEKSVALVDCRAKTPAVSHLYIYSERKEKHDLQSVSFSPCGTLLQAATSHNELFVFDVRFGSGVPLARLRHKFPPIEEQSFYQQGAYRTVWAPHGKILLSGGDDGCVRIWDLKRSQTDCALKTIHAHSQGITALDISDDGSAVVSGSDDLKVGLFTSKTSNLKFGKGEVPDMLMSQSSQRSQNH